MVMAGEAEAGSAGGQPARNILSETHSDECRGDGGFVFSPGFHSWVSPNVVPSAVDSGGSKNEYLLPAPPRDGTIRYVEVREYGRLPGRLKTVAS
jgi:hypothetical protein